MSGPGEWFAVDILVDAEVAEAVESALGQTDCLGTETDTWKKVPGEPLRVSGFFNTLPDLTNIENSIARELEIHGFSSTAIQRIAHRTIEQTDWLSEWKKHWRPVEVGQFVVAPPWGEVASNHKHVIRIEPNMAFGTGTHETTQLCLTAIGEHLTSGQSFFDVGTGTGILAIGAAQLGASTIVACDIDPDSIEIARENARANGVVDKIELYCGSIDNETRLFDVVCANLTLDTILPIVGPLIEKSRKVLILSGILTEQQEAIRTEFLKFGISALESEAAGEWLSVIVQR